LFEEKRDQNQDVYTMEWKDIAALCIAVYQVLFPRLLAIIAGTVFVSFLLLWYFSR
jgi:hypothetical protein